jgi:hypothetical protein
MTKENEKNSVLQYALKYAHRGWPVLAVHSIKDGSCTCRRSDCSSPGKHPRFHSQLQPSGVKSANWDTGTIRQIFQKYPNGNIGIATGQQSFVALDVDLPDGPDSLQKLEQQFGKLPDTLKNRTGGGGFQLLFKHPGVPIKNSVKHLGPGLDIRSDGGYVVVPPSIHASGKRYRWDRPVFATCALAEMPAWLIGLLQKHNGTQSTPVTAPVHQTTDADTDKSDIPEGQRNDTLTRIAGGLHAKGFEREQIKEELRHINATRCKPPLNEAEVDRIAESVCSYATEGRKGDQRKQNVLLDLLKAKNLELFHTRMDECYAALQVNGHREVWALDSKRFSQLCQGLYHNAKKEVLLPQEFRMVTELLQHKALSEGEERPVFVRVAGFNGAIYLDMCNPDWQVIEVTAKGWRIIPQSPVYFVRSKSMNQLAPPEPNGNLRELKYFLPSGTRILTVAWLVNTLNPNKPYPVLVLQGGEGSAKSTVASILTDLVDPHAATLRTPPKTEEDLLIRAQNNRIIVYDNLSSFPVWLSDAICRLSTGGGLSKRTQYTNADEFILEATRPVILNGISLNCRADLSDRAIFINLPKIPDEKRIPESEFIERFNRAKPKLLGALLDAVSTALKNLEGVELDKVSRMGDFVKFIVAAEPSLPWSEGMFKKVYTKNRQEAKRDFIDTDTVSSTIKQLVDQKNQWEGTASELLKDLKSIAGPFKASLPKSPNNLATKLREARPTLGAVGIDISFGRKSDKRTIRLKQI